MLCPSCGEQNLDTAISCTMCGVRLQARPAPPPPPAPGSSSDVTLGGLIPVRNPSALAAYYLGIFSFIPLLGAPLGVIAFILGIKGLKLARRQPEVKGATHAWVGIITGGLFGAFYLFIIAWIIKDVLD